MSYKSKLFTISEIIMILIVIIILISIVMINNNPNKKLVDIRNNQRREDVRVILMAIRDYAKDHNNEWPVAIYNNQTEICLDDLECEGLIKLSSDLVPNYLAELPIDPSFNKQAGTSIGYSVFINDNNQVVVLSPHAENSASISLPR